MLPTITICICTYKRPDLLAFLLEKILYIRTDNLFDCSVLVIDNDPMCSAKKVSLSFKNLRFPVSYVSEPRVSISHARNRALTEAAGEYIAFIDDDEYPTPEWLFFLFKTLHDFQADAVLGPVRPDYQVAPPSWIIKNKIYDRPIHQTGQQLDWSQTRSGNILLKRTIFDNPDNRFNPVFGNIGGEDKDLFYRIIKQRYKFVWSNEAVVIETIPPSRFLLKYLLKRALMRGQASIYYPELHISMYFKSIVALVSYGLILPFLLMFSFSVFVKFLIKSCDHLGRLLGFVGIQLFRGKDYHFEKTGGRHA